MSKEDAFKVILKLLEHTRNDLREIGIRNNLSDSNITLIEGAINRLISAFKEIFEELGFPPGESCSETVDIYLNGIVIYTDGYLTKIKTFVSNDELRIVSVSLKSCIGVIKHNRDNIVISCETGADLTGGKALLNP